jgi:hypothetical protein
MQTLIGKTPRTALGVAVLTLLGLATTEAHAARFVKMEIRVNGKLVLESSTGDDGHPDADEVWSYLNQRAFAPTKDFPADPAGKDANELVLEGDPEQGNVELRVRYGGTANTRRLKLIRISAEDGRNWKVAPEEVARLFDERTITRRQAAQLKTPELPPR